MLERNFTKTFGRDTDAALSVSISPCTWMYPGYGFQIQVRLEETGGVAYLIKKGLSFEDATEADIDALLAPVKIVRCPRCKSPAFDPATIETNRGGECEKCFLGDLNKEYEAALKKEAAAQKKVDAKMKANGMTHRVDAWIHPAGGGDDRRVSLYCSAAPTKALIKKELKKAGSGVFDDYTITKL